MSDKELYEPIEPAKIVPLLRQYADDYLRADNGFSAALMTAAADELERLSRLAL